MIIRKFTNKVHLFLILPNEERAILNDPSPILLLLVRLLILGLWLFRFSFLLACLLLLLLAAVLRQPERLPVIGPLQVSLNHQLCLHACERHVDPLHAVEEVLGLFEDLDLRHVLDLILVKLNVLIEAELFAADAVDVQLFRKL